MNEFRMGFWYGKNVDCEIFTGLMNLIKIISLTCTPLLICHGVEDLRTPHYGLHVHVHVQYQPIKKVMARI